MDADNSDLFAADEREAMMQKTPAQESLSHLPCGGYLNVPYPTSMGKGHLGGVVDLAMTPTPFPPPPPIFVLDILSQTDGMKQNNRD
jgi:hypothetical protein